MSTVCAVFFIFKSIQQELQESKHCFRQCKSTGELPSVMSWKLWINQRLPDFPIFNWTFNKIFFFFFHCSVFCGCIQLILYVAIKIMSSVKCFPSLSCSSKPKLWDSPTLLLFFMWQIIYGLVSVEDTNVLCKFLSGGLIRAIDWDTGAKEGLYHMSSVVGITPYK